MRNFFLLLCCFTIFSCNSEKESLFFNPEKSIQLEFGLGVEGNPYYKVYKDQQVVIDSSRLGLIRKDADFSKNLSVVSISDGDKISDSYTMQHGKQRYIEYNAVKYRVELENAEGKPMNIIFKLSDDGVAFKYHFPEQTEEIKNIKQELTEYTLPDQTRGWLQPMSKAKTGWESTNPSYEEEYLKNVSLDSNSSIGEGFVYPALFSTPTSWVVISESGLHRNYVGSRLLKGYQPLFPL